MFVLNSVTISGRLGQAPESIADGKGCRFSVAVEESFKDSNDEWQKKTNWISVTAWGSVATQIQKKLGKGSEVAIQGKLREERWEKDGEKRSKVGIVVFAFHTEYRDDNGGGHRYEADVPPDTAGMGSAQPAQDDIPFARPRIPDRETRRRDLFTGDRFIA